MKVVKFSDYQQNSKLSVLDGARWLLITHQELSAAATILFHSELLDILVAVDFRGAKISVKALASKPPVQDSATVML